MKRFRIWLKCIKFRSNGFTTNQTDAGCVSRIILTVRSWAGYERVSRLAGRSSSPVSPLQQPAGPVLACGCPSHGSPHHCSPDRPPSQRWCVEGLSPWQAVLGSFCAPHWAAMPVSGMRGNWVQPRKWSNLSSRPRSYPSDNPVYLSATGVRISFHLTEKNTTKSDSIWSPGCPNEYPKRAIRAHNSQSRFVSLTLSEWSEINTDSDWISAYRHLSRNELSLTAACYIPHTHQAPRQRANRNGANNQGQHIHTIICRCNAYMPQVRD